MAVTNTVAGQVTRFYRDADGNLVKKSDGAGTVMIVNAIFEHITTTNESTSYYLFGGQRVAMRVAGAVYWLHGDHLGSASLTTNVSGQKVAELRYLPFGETRWAWGTTPTDRRLALSAAEGYTGSAKCRRSGCTITTRACTGRRRAGLSARIRWCRGRGIPRCSIGMRMRSILH